MHPGLNSSDTVDVVVPHLNRTRYLKRLLNSVAVQTHPVSTIHLIDNGSSDEELRVLDSIVTEFKTSHGLNVVTTRTSVIGNANIARNMGMELSSARFVAFLDSDDWWNADHIYKSLEQLKLTGKAGVYGGAIIHKRGVTLRRSFNISMVGSGTEFLFGRRPGFAQTSSFVVDKYRIKEVGIQWDERLLRNQDYDYFLTIQNYSNGWAFVSEPSVHVDWSATYGRRRLDTASMVLFSEKWKNQITVDQRQRNARKILKHVHFDSQNQKHRDYFRAQLLEGAGLNRPWYWLESSVPVTTLIGHLRNTLIKLANYLERLRGGGD